MDVLRVNVLVLVLRVSRTSEQLTFSMTRSQNMLLETLLVKGRRFPQGLLLLPHPVLFSPKPNN